MSRIRMFLEKYLRRYDNFTLIYFENTNRFCSEIMTFLNLSIPETNRTMAPPNHTIVLKNLTMAYSDNKNSLSHSQDFAIEIIERTGAAISVPCVVFLIWSFLAYQRLRTPSNTLLFNASPANLFAGIASLIGRAGLSRPNAATCQVQGLFLEW